MPKVQEFLMLAVDMTIN